MQTQSTDSSEDREPFVEVDPTGRYGRYPELLGSGAVKNVYRGFDLEEGRDIAWNQVKLRNFTGDQCAVKRLYSEIKLLKTLKNENLIVLYGFWRDSEKNHLNFITEACASGNLRDYRKKHKRVSLKALKKWSRQILNGLDYLHTHEPCVIHRDLNCSNIFINGNIGKVKIGDLGLAAVVGKSHVAHSLIGTPEYMAPELYEEDYNELVDIYSFGLCLLEMDTMEIPYMECNCIAQIYNKVTKGVMPLALNKVKDPELKALIEKCIGKSRVRPSAAELLKDPFLEIGDDETNAGNYETQMIDVTSDEALAEEDALPYHGMSDALFDVGTEETLKRRRWNRQGNYAKWLIQVSSIIDKLPPSWKDFKHMLKHNKDELSLVQLGSHFRIEETLRMKESEKVKGKDIVGSSSMNMVECDKNKKNNKNSKGNKRKFHDKKDDSNKKSKMDDEIAWWIDLGATCHVCKDRCWFDTFHPVKDGSVLHMGNKLIKPIFGHENVVTEFVWGCRAVVRLPEPKKKNLGEKGIDCIFIGYAFIGYVEHSKEYRFYVIEPNDLISVNSIIESRDAIFDKNRFSSIPRPKDIVSSSNGTQGGDLSGETPTKTSEPRRSNKARVAKSYGSDFQLYLVEGSRDEIAYSYCYSIE
ncbi:probable serine/threonine-protein kinase WNK11 [Tanacetum coccineum]